MSYSPNYLTGAIKGIRQETTVGVLKGIPGVQTMAHIGISPYSDLEQGIGSTKEAKEGVAPPRV